MRLVLSSRARLLGVIFLAVAVSIAAALTATTRAGSIRTDANVTVLPHLMSAGRCHSSKSTSYTKRARVPS
jgi:hypothetical protein